MRIVLLSDRIPPESVGGAGKIAWSLAVGLQQAGHEVHVIAATREQPFEIVRDGIPTYHLHSRYPERLRSWLSLYNPPIMRPLRQLLTKIRPDVFNAHNIHVDLSYASLRLAHQLNFPVVLTAHDLIPVVYNKLTYFVNPVIGGTPSPDQYRLPRFFNLRENRFRYNPVRNMVIRQILWRYTQARIAVSHAQKTALEINDLPPFEVIHNGIEPFQKPSEAVIEALRQQFDLAGKRVILVGGRLSREKGSQQILLALDRVVRDVPNACLFVLSASSLDQQVISTLKFATQQHIRSGGWLSGDELLAAYYLADVVTVPSIYLDPLPTINLEAMAAGKPLVSTCYGGSSEIVVDGQTGYVVNPFDTEQFAGRIITLLQNPTLAQQMGAAGRERLETTFSLTQQVARTIKVHQKAQEL